MTELEKYEAVNKCENLDELSEVILLLANKDGQINGRSKPFDAKKMSNNCLNLPRVPFRLLTRTYGIRQQAMYILHYTAKIQKIPLLKSHIGSKVTYIPSHANGDASHPDAEGGTISSWNDMYIFVDYGTGTNKATPSDKLVWG